MIFPDPSRSTIHDLRGTDFLDTTGLTLLRICLQWVLSKRVEAQSLREILRMK
jgi:hypothetical protein